MLAKKPLHLEVQCHDCGKAISAIPTWLVGAVVKFECEECRQRHPRPLGGPDMELRRTPSVPAPDEEPLPDDEDEATDDNDEAEAAPVEATDEE